MDIQELNRMVADFLDHIVMQHLHILLDYHIGAHKKHKADDQPQTDLSDNLELAVHAFLVLPEHLDIVVGKSRRP